MILFRYIRMMDYCIQLVEVQITLPLKFFRTEGTMVQPQIHGHVVSSYTSFSLVIFPLMIEIRQCSTKRYYQSIPFFFVLANIADDLQIANQICKGDIQIPKWLSPGARNLIKRILDPNPRTRITMEEIKENEWFKQDYTPLDPTHEEEEEGEEADAFAECEISSVRTSVIFY